jgi:SAM-dependent methyltransferase
MTIAEFYDEFYERALDSRAHAVFCERVYGKNLCQHGMADDRQIDMMLAELGLDADSRVLDVGCGPGLISDDIQRRTGCRMVGLDISPAAIRRAADLQHEKLHFLVGDILRNVFPNDVFDAILLIDTHYFIDDFTSHIPLLMKRVKAGGKIAVFSDEGAGIGGRDESETKAHETIIGKSLIARGIRHKCIRLHKENAAHWRKKERVLLELRDAFEKEGNRFLYDNRLGECTEHDRSLDGRYLFIIEKT